MEETPPEPKMDNTLARFHKPPVIEALLSVQFDSVPDFTNAHLGVFWKTLGIEWPHVSDAPKVEPEVERFGDQFVWRKALHFRLGQDGATRLQIRNANRTRMIQVQNGRLIYNWTAQPEVAYPTYGQLRPEFDKTLDLFAKFLGREGLGELRYNQWEVTYVNHIPKGTVWETSIDWPKLFSPPLCPFPTAGLPPKLESLSGAWHFEIEPKQGRLHIELEHGLDGLETRRELLVLKLTARGPIREGDPNLALGEGLDLGHTTIVESFTAITSAEAHRYWRKYQ